MHTCSGCRLTVDQNNGDAVVFRFSWVVQIYPFRTASLAFRRDAGIDGNRDEARREPRLTTEFPYIPKRTQHGFLDQVFCFVAGVRIVARSSVHDALISHKQFIECERYPSVAEATN